jgi:hypothetical protein
MKRYQPIVAVEPGKKLTLQITWKDKTVSTIDLAPVIKFSKHLAPLSDRELFKTARVSPEGFAVEWSDDLDLSAAQLWRWAGEQAGEFMRTEDFQNWRQRNGLSLSGTADALGLSRRTVAYYASGEEPIPKTVLLACLGFEAQKAA